jgi:hypothetical protein
MMAYFTVTYLNNVSVRKKKYKCKFGFSDTGEPAMKKSFGQPAVTTSSTPFQLGANSGMFS